MDWRFSGRVPSTAIYDCLTNGGGARYGQRIVRPVSGSLRAMQKCRIRPRVRNLWRAGLLAILPSSAKAPYWQRLYENSKMARFRVSLYPCRTVLKPVRGDLVSRGHRLGRSVWVFMQPRPDAANRGPALNASSSTPGMDIRRRPKGGSVIASNNTKHRDSLLRFCCRRCRRWQRTRAVHKTQ